MIVLGIESSCDELAMAIIDNEKICASIIVSQCEHHKHFGGVVPEIASRLHVEYLIPTLKNLLSKCNGTLKDIQAIAFTNRPGLIGSLLTGVCFGKSLAWALDKPFIGIDHITAHWYINHLIYPKLKFPYLAVVVSGGHTLILLVESLNKFCIIGRTLDDAIGECYDKISKFHNLGYPGGPIIDQLSQQGDPYAYKFPYPSLHKQSCPFNVSYSGLKNAATNQCQQFHDKNKGSHITDLLASFQRVAIGILVSRIPKIFKKHPVNTLVIGGGVAANSYLRSELDKMKDIVNVYYPPPQLCGDNAEMIAYLGHTLLKHGRYDSLDLNALTKISYSQNF